MRNIENISSIDEVRKEIERQNIDFDLYNFYMENSDYDFVLNCALGIITPRQSLYCYSFGEHSRLFEKIGDALYDDFYDVFKSNDYYWIDTTLDLNCISLRLVSKYYSLIWVPSQITLYQYEQLYNFYVKMYQVNYALISKSQKPISVMTNVKDENGLDLDLNQALPYIFKRINNNFEVRDEHIISSNKQICKKL